MTNQINNQSIIPSTDVIQLTLSLKMTTAQVVETSVTVNNNSPIQDYVHPDDQTQPTFESNSSWLWWIMSVLLANQKRKNFFEWRIRYIHWLQCWITISRFMVCGLRECWNFPQSFAFCYYHFLFCCKINILHCLKMLKILISALFE